MGNSTCIISTLPLSLSGSIPLFFFVSLTDPLTVSSSPTLLSQILPFCDILFLPPPPCHNSFSFHVYHIHMKPLHSSLMIIINTYNACICSLCVTIFVKILTQQGSKQFFIGVPGIKERFGYI